MSGIRRALALAAFSLGILLVAGLAAAHPAGFTSINRYIGIGWSAPGRIHVAYLIDFAELPAYAEIDGLDADHDGTATPDEQRAYLERRLPPLVAAWTILVDGVRLTPIVTGSSLQISPGERGLETLRIAADVEAKLPRGDAEPAMGAEVKVIVRDASFAERPGWREMAAEESPSAVVISGATGQARNPLAYAQGSGAPPRVDDGRFAFRWRGAAPGSSPAPDRAVEAVAVDARVADWSRALERSSGSLALSLVALALALALGAGHALSPGHGKALAAAYLVGERARAGDALLFGAAVTVAHTLVVFAIGCAALALDRSVGSERLLRGLESVSAGAVAALGVIQVSRRFREATAARGHDHGHPAEPGVGWRSLVALGASAGLTPCPSALALLLAAIALRRYVFGLVLVGAFSVGVAATLTIVGLIALAARGRLSDRAETSPWAATLRRWLPVVSSASVLLVGVLLCASAWSRP